MKLICKIEGMHCNGCRTTLENELNESKNIESASVDLESATARVVCDENVSNKDIEKIVKKAGFKCVEIIKED